jgi:hypothetical protein
MRYPLVLGIAAIGIAALRFLITRPAIHTVEEAHSPEEILLQKQEGLHAAAVGEPAEPVKTLKVATGVSPERHRELVAQTAYFLAKQRGFTPGHEDDDWVVAEAMVGAGQSAPG